MTGSEISRVPPIYEIWEASFAYLPLLIRGSCHF